MVARDGEAHHGSLSQELESAFDPKRTLGWLSIVGTEQEAYHSGVGGEGEPLCSVGYIDFTLTQQWRWR